jgi:hypothetical protein
LAIAIPTAVNHLPLIIACLHSTGMTRRNIMAKGQQRTNKEVKKPKKDKQTTAPIGTFIPMPKTTLPHKSKA